MKNHSCLKVKGTARVNHQQVMFELKQRVISALNKLADRDTYQIGIAELEKTIECLTPDGIALFLSCILDTDSEQKSAVRKECMRLMGLLVNLHDGLVAPYLVKMVGSIVKRLKDSDTVVRDACVETVGVLASKLCNNQGKDDGSFVVLVKPLFEALGEQNKQLQSGSALCLARVIDNTHEPPASILQRMLTRTIKLLKNPHFMAKPAVIELNRSIIQAGGAPSQIVLSAAMSSIQEALKNSDWTTRKAASLSLGEIASSGGSFFSSFKASCIHSLESCRFDKVKPVRDTVPHALHLWRSLPGPDQPEPSETGSSIKENFCGLDDVDIGSVNEFGQKDASLTKMSTCSTKKRIPLSVRKACPNYLDYPQGSIDWDTKIAAPKTQSVCFDIHNEESEGSSVTKTLDRMSSDITSIQDLSFEYVSMDDRHECSSVSKPVTKKVDTKFVSASRDCINKVPLVKPMVTNQEYTTEETRSQDHRYSVKMHDHSSLDSIGTESSSPTLHECCTQTTKELASIRKQLLEIDNKQSNLTDMLQQFTMRTMESFSVIQLKVAGLEQVVDQIARDVCASRLTNPGTAKFLKKSQSVASPRLSTHTSRPSLDMRNRQPSILSKKSMEMWEEKSFAGSRSSSSAIESFDMWSDVPGKLNRQPIQYGSQSSSACGTHVVQTRKSDNAAASATSARQNSSEIKNGLWRFVRGYLSEGDLDSAYAEALFSGDEIVLFELIDRTGPVLERLSNKTAGDVLSTLASYFLEQRFLNSIIPWLQQVVDLITGHGPNCLVLPAKVRREFLSAIQEAANMGIPNPAERRSVAQLATKLHQIWGKCT